MLKCQNQCFVICLLHIYARLSIVGTTATLWRTHLAAHVDISLQLLSLRAAHPKVGTLKWAVLKEVALIETIVPLSKRNCQQSF
jgi:hypothetical protein